MPSLSSAPPSGCIGTRLKSKPLISPGCLGTAIAAGAAGSALRGALREPDASAPELADGTSRLVHLRMDQPSHYVVFVLSVKTGKGANVLRQSSNSSTRSGAGGSPHR